MIQLQLVSVPENVMVFKNNLPLSVRKMTQKPYSILLISTFSLLHRVIFAIYFKN